MACRSICDYNRGTLISNYMRRMCGRSGVTLKTVIISEQMQYSAKKYARSCSDLRGQHYLLALQGSSHLETSLARVINEFLLPHITNVKQWFSKCLNSVHVVYTGATVCHNSLERKYPHQHREKIKEHNLGIKIWLEQNHPDVIFLDPYNVTLNALNDPLLPRSSDGFHFLSDVNILYANVILNLMYAVASDLT